MAVIYPIRPFLWTQIRGLCILAFSAVSNWQLATGQTQNHNRRTSALSAVKNQEGAGL